MQDIGAVSQGCQDTLKNFLCKFYFSYCKIESSLRDYVIFKPSRSATWLENNRISQTWVYLMIPIYLVYAISICNGSLNIAKPDIDLFTCGLSQFGDTAADQRKAAMNSNAAFSAYLASEGQTQPPNNSPSGTSNGGIAGWKIAVIVIGVLVGVGLVSAGGFFLYRRNKRQGYATFEK